VAVQTDGKIVLGGMFTSVNNQPRSRIARLNSNGNVEDSATFNPGSGANNGVFGMAVQTDGKIVLSGDFTAVNGTVRNAIARLDNNAATQPVTVPDAAQVLWTRSGAEPEVSQVTFDLSTDRRRTWTPLGIPPGLGVRIGTTSNWQLTGLSLPTSGEIRARGFMASGNETGSSGITQQAATFGALEMLIVGNKRYSDGAPIHPNQSPEQRAGLTKSQAPFAIVVGCADSRVPPEIVFDQGLGDLFVVRVAGEVVDAFGLGTIEYGVGHLDSLLIVVLGHEECGAVKAAVYNEPAHGNLKTLVDAIKANIGETTNVEEAVKKNARKVADVIREDLIKEHLYNEKKVKIVTGYYSLHSGTVIYFQ
jgi:carbonic anhydrase